MKKLLFAFTLLNSIGLFAQNGTIRGIIFEKESGQTVIGANVAILDPLTGTSTDLDGKYSISIAPGTYDIKVSYISFQTQHIKGVVVKSGEVTVLDDVYLKSAAMELGVVEVTATATRKSEAALNMMKKKSVAMMDGISAEKMELTGDASAVDAAKRVTGVSIEGGKYVYVRGLGDRYSKVTLNQIDIPGLDPDKNSLQMDLFPTNLIDNIVVSKNFTADMPADFTGGLMNIETKAFPDEPIFNVSFGTSINPDMHFNNDFLTYEGGKTDFLAIEDGTRDKPDLTFKEEVPTPVQGSSSGSINDFTSSFNPELGSKRNSSLLDYSMGLTLGNQLDLNEEKGIFGKLFKRGKLGYIFSLSYSSDYKYYSDVVYGEYQLVNNPSVYEMTEANLQTGEIGERNFLLGGLAGLAYKTQQSKIRLTLMRIQASSLRTGRFDIKNNPAGIGQSGYVGVTDNLEYNQRELTNILLHGNHVFKKSGWEVDWKISPTISNSEDPDIRRTPFTVNGDNYSLAPGQAGMPNRIWRDLNESSFSARLDIAKEYNLFGSDAKFSFGTNNLYKEREYEILEFLVQLRSTISQSWDSPDPNQILSPENIYPNRPNGVYYVAANNRVNSNAYSSNIMNNAFYVSNEMQLSQNLKTIFGVRMERYVQRHTGRDINFASGNFENGRNLENEVVIDDLDFFPTLNFVYNLAEEQNLRLSYSQTVARPSFKEVSFAQILDPMTNRIFNGALFPYSDWEGNIQVTKINNFDIRWEKFLEKGQIFSASAFYKTFDNPIELVRIPEQQTSTEYQPRNVGDGKVYGIELEATKSLDFIGLDNFSFSGNLTLVHSEIIMTDREFNFRKEFEKEGQNVDNKRPMAGQAPYVINFGISYNNIEKGLKAGLFYNVKGPALEIVGAGLFPDVYQEPFHNLSLGVNKRLGEENRTAIDFKISNILGDRIESFYEAYNAQDQIFSSMYPGRAFSIGLSHKF